jgi:hypothetical protein
MMGMKKSEFINKIEEFSGDILVVFDNGGGVAMEIGDYKHYYENPVQASEDLLQAVKDNFDSSGWEGNEEELEVEEDNEMERNGGIKAYARYDIAKALKNKDFECGWSNVDVFIVTLASNLR